MSKECLCVKEEDLLLFIDVIKNGIATSNIPERFADMLNSWCNSELEYIEDSLTGLEDEDPELWDKYIKNRE